VKTFWSVQDIEDLAARGATELVVDESMVLTDLAKHTAQQLGITLTYPSASAAPAPMPHSHGAGAPVPGLGAKPRGCQHGPLSEQRLDQQSGPSGSDTVVDQLVGIVKRLGGRSSTG
jgi:hypothetical protein